MTNKIALVTGASRGIGAATALALARAGCDVAINYRSSESAANAVAAQVNELGRETLIIQADVSEAQAVEAMVNAVVERWGRLDVLVNNAGIGAGSEHPWDLPVEEWWAVHEVNVKGPYICTQAAMRYMSKQQSGRIIDVGSLVATYPNPSAAPYSASKAALFRWNSCLAEGAKDVGVSVFIISPGLVATDMTDIPQFADIPADQWVPIEKTGELVVALASGKADVLAGRFIHALDDLDSLIENADKIVAENLQTISMQMLNEL